MKDLLVDAADLLKLGVDLEAAGVRALTGTREVVQRGALNIKRGTQKRWSGHAHAPALPRAVTYDTHDTLTGASAEIGPDKDKRQGALGNLFEYGSVKNAPIPGLAPELALEEPKFLKALGDLGERAAGL